MTEIDYRSCKAINNSSLGWWLKSEYTFYEQYVLGKTTKETPAMRLGSAIHCKILEPERFSKEYSVVPARIIYPTAKMSEVFMIAEETNDYSDNNLLTIAKQVFDNNWKDDTIMKKVSQYSSYITFLNYCKENNIIPITSEQMDVVNKCYDSVLKVKSSGYYTTLRESEDVNVYNEHTVYFDYLNIKCKSKLDKLIINHKTKEVIIIDYKSTGHPLRDFPEQVKKYDYLRELAFYFIAASMFITNELKQDPAEYKFSFKLIAMQTNEFFKCKVFNVATSDINRKYYEILILLRQIKHALDTNDYFYDESYVDDFGEVLLDIN